jgi:hypothetical protein
MSRGWIVAEISLRLSKREAEALAQHVGGRKSNARRAAEFKLRGAIWAAYPELRDERDAHDDERFRQFRKSVGLA